ncbi:unnamed protein product [Paramecium sonneborni]|uniref:Uncharacterized protein n=1 Tax=Paramecium sonneborni TaxID=65129 RepID=A0A8S1LZT0_9CILI|nr:unnamed protein product [Paramecium sonneborni]
MNPQPTKFISPQERIQDIVAFINDPKEDNSEKVFDHIQALCQIKSQTITNPTPITIPIPKIVYASPKYCALSGENLQDDCIKINELYFSPRRVQDYYFRNGILDVSIGDLIFNYHDGVKDTEIEIELTYEILKEVFGDNLDHNLKAAYTHFNRRLSKQQGNTY